MWLLFLHQIPPTPPYLRAKVMRRLTQLGALPIKNSAYLLPANDDSVEDFEWLRREIVQGGGEAWLFRAEAVAGWSDDGIREAFRRLRAPDYADLLEETRAAGDEPQRRRLRQRFEDVKRIDFFGAPGRAELEALMKAMTASAQTAGELRGRLWVTRKGVKVDRIASAWLIRRFLDPAARFRFVDPNNYTHAPAELRFDMFEGEFTHEGDLCTFEVLARKVAPPDAALAAVGEVVHDIDLKDAKFGRPETAGIATLIEGLAARHTDDERRIAEGSTIFEALYAQFGGGA